VFSFAEELNISVVVQCFADAVDPAKTNGFIHCFAPGYGRFARLLFVMYQPNSLFGGMILFQPVPPGFSGFRIKGGRFVLRHGIEKLSTFKITIQN
jgi:hypothetical protein